MTRSTLAVSFGLVSLLFLSLAPALAPAAPAVAVVGLELRGELPAPVQQALHAQLGKGLAKSGLQVAPAAAARVALGTQYGRCTTPECRRSAAGKLACRYVVGGSVAGDDDRTYDIDLWLADGYSGRVIASVQQRCELCGLQAIAEKMDLAASALAAKLNAAATAPGRLVVQTEPRGAMIFVDGDAVGAAPREIELPAGTHEIAADAPGHIRSARTVTSVAGVQERLELRLIPQATRSVRRIVGWVSVAAGVASLAAGIALFAINGETRGCPSPDIPGGQCAEERHTIAPASALTALGVVAMAGGGYLIWSANKKERDARRAGAPRLAWDF
jgi:hypothetical protein